MTPIPIFSNPYDITDNKFIEMIDKYDKCRNMTDDYPLIREMKRIIGIDYYKYAKEWFDRFKDANWYREDLI